VLAVMLTLKTTISLALAVLPRYWMLQWYVGHWKIQCQTWWVMLLPGYIIELIASTYLEDLFPDFLDIVVNEKKVSDGECVHRKLCMCHLGYKSLFILTAAHGMGMCKFSNTQLLVSVANTSQNPMRWIQIPSDCS